MEKKKGKKTNCWEHMKCGRGPGGLRVLGYGECSAAIEKKVDGINGGKNGGRACWAVAGTMCHGKIQGRFAEKFGSCLKCDFFQLVLKEEGENFENLNRILKKLKNIF